MNEKAKIFIIDDMSHYLDIKRIFSNKYLKIEAGEKQEKDTGNG